MAGAVRFDEGLGEFVQIDSELYRPELLCPLLIVVKMQVQGGGERGARVEVPVNPLMKRRKASGSECAISKRRFVLHPSAQ